MRKTYYFYFFNAEGNWITQYLESQDHYQWTKEYADENSMEGFFFIITPKQ